MTASPAILLLRLDALDFKTVTTNEPEQQQQQQINK